MWESPIVDLVKEMDIDTLLLPLSWWDLFPHQLAHSNEDAWARGLQINILSANTHNSAGWSSGSGIYSSNGHLAYVHDLSLQSGGTFLVADLDIKPAKVISLNFYSTFLNLSLEKHYLVPIRQREC